jgi:hypothetical protein
MIQLGCCDFNLKKNMKNENININNLSIYNPKELALGAYGNIYNINFAKIIYYENTHVFKEFDSSFDMYYNKYNIGICYPNLITAELSTTNLNHNYSLFKDYKHLDYNNYYINNCFYNFDYKDYYFIWIIFIKECYEYYMKTNELLNMKSYYQLIYDFSSKSNIEHIIIDVLNNNNINFNDVNKILEFIINDKILIDKKPVIKDVVETIVEPVVEPVIKDVIETIVEPIVIEPVIEPLIKDVVETIVEPIVIEQVIENIVEPIVIEPVIETIVEPVIKDVVEPVIPVVEPVIKDVVESIVIEPVIKPVIKDVVESIVIEPVITIQENNMEHIVEDVIAIMEPVVTVIEPVITIEENVVKPVVNN